MTTKSYIVCKDKAQTLTNKTIDADSNVITNIEVAELKSTAVSTAIPSTGAVDTKLATEKAVADRHLYMHVINVRNTSTTAVLACGMFLTTSSTAFTIATLAKWLYDNGFTSTLTVYPSEGVNAANFYYVAESSGGSPTKSTAICSIATGFYSTDGSSLRIKNNFNGYSPITDATKFYDTVLTII